jgi:nitrate/TMAO reductase-like tetraheme cytochrome c subunit
VNERPYRPILVLLTANWLTMAGSALVTLAGFAWLFLLPVNLRGRVDNPYLGLLVFVAVPVVFFTGLILIPIGLVLARKRGGLALEAAEARRVAWRRAAVFFLVMTAANVVIGSQASYRAVEHMDTQQFCGQSCHAMQPQFAAHISLPHSQVDCVACHVTPGADGWAKAKTAGMRQLIATLLDNYPRPIESALESGRLAPSAETCEHCHARDAANGPRLLIIPNYAEDQENTRTDTVLMMPVDAIHRAHMAGGVEIRYGALDAKRRMIPRVEYRDTKNGHVRTYLAGGASGQTTAALPMFTMQCVDCHNRVAHAFEAPARALDRAFASGELPADLPFLKKASVPLLGADYGSQEEAMREIPGRLMSYFTQEHPAVAAERRSAIETAGAALASIYRRNVFPDLKVNWETYVENMGHVSGAGCFRCHDNNHTARTDTGEERTLSQDCASCHQVLAVEETRPEILRTLGLGAPVR